MARVLLDTDILIKQLRGQAPIRPRGHRLHYSVVTRAELFVGGNEAVIRELLEPLTELPVERAIAERAGRLCRTTGMHLSDALVAATALEHGLQLCTGNVRDFRGVRGLRVRTEL